MLDANFGSWLRLLGKVAFRDPEHSRQTEPPRRRLDSVAANAGGSRLNLLMQAVDPPIEQDRM